MFLFR